MYTKKVQQGMFNPTDIRQWRAHEYEGTLHTALRVFESKTKPVDTFRVERPLSFLQRADCDVSATIQALFPQTQIDLPGAFRPLHDNLRATQVPHGVTQHDVSFPIVQLTTGCRFNPETPNQDWVYYDSDPKQLLDLARILCMEKRLKRTSKTQLETELWAAHHAYNAAAVSVPFSTIATHAYYRWMFRTDPGNSLQVRVNQVETVWTAREVDSHVRVDVIGAAGAAFSALPVFFDPTRFGAGGFSTATATDSENTTIYVHPSLVYPGPLLWQYVEAGTGHVIRIQHYIYQVSEFTQEVSQDGYTYFSRADQQPGYIDVPLIFQGVSV